MTLNSENANKQTPLPSSSNIVGLICCMNTKNVKQSVLKCHFDQKWYTSKIKKKVYLF
jgi:hypothetical protein